MLETERRYHLAVEAWGAKEGQLDNEGLLKDLLQPATNEVAKEIIHPFEPHGITGIVLERDGTITSAHHWPEHQYGIYTFYGPYSKSNPFIKRILDIYSPSGQITIRPDDIKHLMSTFDTQNENALEETSLLKTGLRISDKEKLLVFDSTAVQTNQTLTAILGLESSHLTLQSQKPFIDYPLRRVYIDALTCDGKTNLHSLSETIKDEFNPLEIYTRFVKYPDIRNQHIQELVKEAKCLITEIKR